MLSVITEIIIKKPIKLVLEFASNPYNVVV